LFEQIFRVDLIGLDRKCKKLSNEDWTSRTDPDAKITIEGRHETRLTRMSTTN
jgi:hypothetical protein